YHTMMFAAALLLTLSEQAPTSSFRASEDAAFAHTKEQAAQGGGGAMYAASRERRYLDALRGPDGQALQYKRRGSLPRDEHTILDIYDVTYEGLAQAAVLYLDDYHFDDHLAAPKGFICAVPIGLNAPGPDAFLAMDSVRALAVEQGGAKQFAPISIDADGSAAHGVIFDDFRL